MVFGCCGCVFVVCCSLCVGLRCSFVVDVTWSLLCVVSCCRMLLSNDFVFKCLLLFVVVICCLSLFVVR